MPGGNQRYTEVCRGMWGYMDGYAGGVCTQRGAQTYGEVCGGMSLQFIRLVDASYLIDCGDHPYH